MSRRIFFLTACFAFLAVFCGCKDDFFANNDNEFDRGSNIVVPELDERLIDDLELLGKLWGFLKYHHPRVGKGIYNLDYELFRILPAYLKAKNPQERDKVLLEWINKYGKISDCIFCRKTPSNAYIKPDLSWVTNSDMSDDLKKKIQKIYSNRHQGKHYYINFRYGKFPEFLNEKAYSNMYYPDTGFRLLALYRYWNMIQYFFPYKYQTDKNWNDVLKEYIPIFISAETRTEYELATLQIIGEIHDTHADLWGGGNEITRIRGSNFAPFRVCFIEGKLVVTDYYNTSARPMEIGDIITHINGKTIEDIVDSLRKYYPASNEAARLRNISFDLLRSPKDRISIDYISSGSSGQKEIQLYPRNSLNIYRWFKHEKSYKLLDDNIGYVSLGDVKKEDIQEIRNSFANTKGVIIDIRNYPSEFSLYILHYFYSNKPRILKFAKSTSGNVNNPGEFAFNRYRLIESVLKLMPNTIGTYKGKKVALVNEITISMAEYLTMALRAGNSPTTIIGSTTAGADGNVSEIVLPGGLRTSISGVGIYYPDGTQTQRVGIIPDIWIEPTIEGIRQKRDELVEKSIEIINN